MPRRFARRSIGRAETRCCSPNCADSMTTLVARWLSASRCASRREGAAASRSLGTGCLSRRSSWRASLMTCHGQLTQTGMGPTAHSRRVVYVECTLSARSVAVSSIAIRGQGSGRSSSMSIFTRSFAKCTVGLMLPITTWSGDRRCRQQGCYERNYCFDRGMGLLLDSTINP